jgi:putative endonuclease
MERRARKTLGNLGERLAAGKLTEKGYRIISTNWRCEIGELDIVAWHGDCLTFIEVRTRRGVRAGTPEESITPAKRQRLQNLVDAYLISHTELQDGKGQPPPCRVDLAAVEFEPGGKLVRLDLIENIIN